MNLRNLLKSFLLALLLLSQVSAYDGGEFVENAELPIDTDESFDEMPPEQTSYPNQKPYIKPNYNVNADEAEQFDSAETLPVDDYQDYGVDTGAYDSGTNEYDSDESYDY